LGIFFSGAGGRGIEARLACRGLAVRAQGFEDGADDEAAHGRLAAEADFAFGRVHVYVHGGGVDFEEDEGDGIAALGERFVEAFDERVVERAAVHGAVVDEGDHFVPRGAALAGAADEAGEAHAVFGGFDGDKPAGDLPSEDARDAFGEGVASGGAEDGASVLDEGEGDAREGERVEAHGVDDVRGLGVVAFQKFAARGDGVEEVRDFDARAGGAAAFADVDEPSAVDDDFGAGVGGGFAGL
jgi:hypothetical protein